MPAVTTPELVFPDGRRVDLDGDIVLGRAPVAPDSSPSARSISLAVPTVSKTHALIGHDASGVWLIDLHSSNGSEVLDDLGMSERATPGQRLSVPAGSHIRVGTDTIITIDLGTAATADDADRTVVVRPAATPRAPVVAPADAGHPVDWSSVTDPDAVVPPPPQPRPPVPAVPAASPTPPLPPVQPPPPAAAQQPPPPAQALGQQPPPPQPPPPSAEPPTQELAQVPGGSFPPAPDHQPPPLSGAVPAAASISGSGASGRSRAHLVGAIIILLWVAVGFATLRRWIPDSVVDAADNRIIGFFVLPERLTLRFFDFYSFIGLPDSLSFLARGADIGPVIAALLAVVAIFVPSRTVRWFLVFLVAIPLVLLLGVVVTLLSDFFDSTVDEIDRFLMWFVLPGVGSLLLLWPSRRSAPAPTPQHDLFYAPEQPPEPPISSPGAPPFS